MLEKLVFGTGEDEYIYYTDDADAARGLIARGEPVLGRYDEAAGTDFSGVRYLFAGEEMPDSDFLRGVWARIKGLPRTVTETNRLLIREAVPSDAPALMRLYEDPEAQKYLPGLKPTVEEEMESIRAYAECVYDFYDYGMWVIALKENGELIGRVGLERYGDREGLELGYMIAAPYRRKGLGEEACRAVLAYAHEVFPEEPVYARVDSNNKASLHLAERLNITIYKE